MGKLSRGVALLLALSLGFVLIDILGCARQTPESDSALQSQYGLVPLSALTPFPTFDLSQLPTLAPTPDATATVAGPTTPAGSPLAVGPDLPTSTPGPTATFPVLRTATPSTAILSTVTPGAPTTVAQNTTATLSSTGTAISASPSPGASRTAAAQITSNGVKEVMDANAAPAQDSVFDALMSPFVAEALKRRAELAISDPDYRKRADSDLNKGRINFLLFGYGESHEPPNTEKAIIGSQTVLSYDIKTRQVDIISLTHDIRGPEIEREFLRRGFKSPAVRIDQAYNVGGFKLMRQTLEDATGLSIDFQVTFKDVVMQDLIDGVFGGVEVDVPQAFDVYAFYLEGKKYEAGHFAKGLQRLNGRQVIQFIKTVPVAEGAYDKSLEHNVRKALILDALLQAVNKNYTDRMFWLKIGPFVAGQMMSGAIAFDFDPVTLMVNNIGPTTANLRKTMGKSSTEGLNLPKIRHSKYIVDPANGDGGVQWVNANAAFNPITRKDIEDGIYPSLDMEVPITANPYGDLPTDYWASVRRLIWETLIHP